MLQLMNRWIRSRARREAETLRVGGQAAAVHPRGRFRPALLANFAFFPLAIPRSLRGACLGGASTDPRPCFSPVQTASWFRAEIEAEIARSLGCPQKRSGR